MRNETRKDVHDVPQRWYDFMLGEVGQNVMTHEAEGIDTLLAGLTNDDDIDTIIQSIVDGNIGIVFQV